VASGGAGSIENFIDAFSLADVDAALAASVFHDGSITIPSLKRALRAADIEVRDAT
jgi:cyclase